MLHLSTVGRSPAEVSAIAQSKEDCKALIRDIGRRPGSTKLLSGICVTLIDQIADAPGAQHRLKSVQRGLKIFAAYKAHRRHPSPSRHDRGR